MPALPLNTTTSLQDTGTSAARYESLALDIVTVLFAAASLVVAYIHLRRRVYVVTDTSASLEAGTVEQESVGLEERRGNYAAPEFRQEGRQPELSTPPRELRADNISRQP